MILLAFLLATLCAGLTGWLFPTGDWYRRLAKPTWTPPNWAFPVVWTTLYLLAALAGARAQGIGGPGAGAAAAFWALQIAANALWTPTVFGARRLRLGVAVIALLWLALLGSVVSHWRVSAFAGLLFVPYFLWASLALALNVQLVRLNPQERG